MKKKQLTRRNPAAHDLALRRGRGRGAHHNRVWDIAKGRSRKRPHQTVEAPEEEGE